MFCTIVTSNWITADSFPWSEFPTLQVNLLWLKDVIDNQPIKKGCVQNMCIFFKAFWFLICFLIYLNMKVVDLLFLSYQIIMFIISVVFLSGMNSKTKCPCFLNHYSVNKRKIKPSCKLDCECVSGLHLHLLPIHQIFLVLFYFIFSINNFIKIFECNIIVKSWLSCSIPTLSPLCCH